MRSVPSQRVTDETCDHDIIDRLGLQFYDEVFVSAITSAREDGKTYKTVRDTIRRGWNTSSTARR